MTTRTVFCRKYQREMEGLPSPPFPGPAGEDVYQNISKQAWQDWQAQQTMLINEKQLSAADPDARRYLREQMKLFFSNQKHDTAEGYVAPDKSD